MPLIAAAAAMATHSDHGTSTVVAVVLAFIGVAIVAILVSQKAQTGGVLGAGGTSLANVIRCALSPVTGGACAGVNTSVSSSVCFPGIDPGC